MGQSETIKLFEEKKLFTILFALVAVSSVWGKDYDFMQGDLYYRITICRTLEVGSANKDISSVIIPATVSHEGTSYSVTHIGHSAFHLCCSLRSVTIPESVTSIREDAFKACRALQAIYYDGIKQQWEQLPKGKDWNRKVPTKVIYCTDGVVEL